MTLKAMMHGRVLFRTDDSPPAVSNTVARWWATDLSGSLADGDPVGTWTDGVGSYAPTASGSARPTYSATGMGGKPTVTFDGSDDYLRLGVSDIFSAYSTGSVVAVVHRDSTSEGTIWCSGAEGASNPYQRWFSGKVYSDNYQRLQYRVSSAGASNDLNLTASIPSAEDIALEWTTSDGTNVYGYLNNFTSGSTGSGTWFNGVVTRVNWVMGAFRGGSALNRFFDGNISFLLVTSSPLSSSDRSAIYYWIERYYGIPMWVW